MKRNSYKQAVRVGGHRLAKKISTCAVGDHCETQTLKFTGLLMAIDWLELKSMATIAS